jgi:hypothetical protein
MNALGISYRVNSSVRVETVSGSGMSGGAKLQLCQHYLISSEMLHIQCSDLGSR